MNKIIQIIAAEAIMMARWHWKMRHDGGCKKEHTHINSDCIVFKWRTGDVVL